MYAKIVKPSFDLIFGTLAIVMSIPLFIAIGLAIKLDDNGPIMFTQKRFGKNKKPFTIYKFRTFKVDAPHDCPTNNLQNPEDHITKVGKIIRKLSLDELPQLINVIKGEMSIVGPRPVILVETDLIAARQKYNANSCKPGITGWAQVNGRDELQISQKAKMDGHYIKKFGMMIDIKCLFLTIWAVISIRGHQEGQKPETNDLIYSEEEL